MVAQRPGRARHFGERVVTALLTNRAAVAIKRPLRDLLWTVKGARIRNPPLPAKVESILFVCLGNICRSPFAALLATNRLTQANVKRIRCASAGIRATQAARSPEAACDAAVAHGLSLVDHRPTTLTRELIDAHDLIVVMEATQLVELRATYPDATDRLFLLSLFDGQASTGYDRYNIADPFSRPRAVFEICFNRIDRSLSRLIALLDERAPR